MVCNTVKHRDREAAYVEMLDRNMLDGLITCAWSAEAKVYRHMDKPIVSMDHNLGEGILYRIAISFHFISIFFHLILNLIIHLPE